MSVNQEQIGQFVGGAPEAPQVPAALPGISLIRPPEVSPDSWSDEFDEGSADLASRGWTIQVVGTGTLATRAGEFDPNAVIAPNTYRSSLFGSKLVLQTADTVFIHKTIAGSAAYATRIFALNQNAGGTQPIALGVSTSPQWITGANQFMAAWNQGNQAKLLRYNAGAYSDQGTMVVISVLSGFDVQWLNLVFTGINLTAAAARIIASASGVISSLTSTFAGSIAYASQYVGVQLNVGPQWFEIDYIRRYPVGQFFSP